MKSYTTEQKIHYVLRIAIAMCFIGHGSFGIITKPIWCNYFGVFGIDKPLAYGLMPLVGTFDILCGIAMLFHPNRAVAMWLVIWGFTTASLRPLSGEPFAEFIERAGNYGAPVALLCMYGIGNWKQWFARLKPDIHINTKTAERLFTCLQMAVFLLIAGHGWLNLLAKKSLLNQYSSLGFTNTTEVASMVGFAEIICAFITLFRPSKQLLIILFAWKIGSELLYPHYELFEWIERGGSYGCILALLLILQPQANKGFEVNRLQPQVQSL